MIDHPIRPVTEPFQYRAIGIVRGIYKPDDKGVFTRGKLIDQTGAEIEAVVLGRVITLMQRHLSINNPHLWVVYPRCKNSDHLHLQIKGVWEPSTLIKEKSQLEDQLIDELPEGDDFFSIRGELIFTKPDENYLIIKVRQKPRSNGIKQIPFKLFLEGNIPINLIRNFINLNVRREGQKLIVEDYDLIGPLPNRSVGKGKRIKNK
tara:strand:+ start:359 stop:973 length:615 start_codon:yes stop_codon:yes gene_type:complete